LRSVGYHVDDIDAAKQWYARLLGAQPYFDEPYYVGFNVGGFELGLHPREGRQTVTDPSCIVYWGVQDIDAALASITAAGASPRLPIMDVGGGVRLATVHDPFGNTIGLIENPNFVQG
jgi:predicted enzyme related to lactoylglutathione lyase